MLFNVKTVYYSTDNGDIMKEAVNDLESRHCMGYSRYLTYIKNKRSPPPPDYREERRRKKKIL